MRSGRRGAVWPNLNAPIKALKYNLKALKKRKYIAQLSVIKNNLF